MNQRENFIRSARFEKPEWIPVIVSINSSCWNHYPQEQLKELMASHKLLFPDYEYSPEPYQPEHVLDARKDQPYTDPWGCVWETTDDGIVGAVTKHPLTSWDNFSSFNAPDPEKTDGRFPVDWNQRKQEWKKAKEQNKIAGGGLHHGHTFLRVCDIHGYENVIMDMADDNPNLQKLLDMICQFNMAVMQHAVDGDVDAVNIAEDLGMQVGPMLSPNHFRKFIKPLYQKYIKKARSCPSDVVVHMHSDGDIRDLVDDILDAGVEIINLQDFVNGIDWIAENLAGKYCIDLDIDRQNVTRFGTPEEIDNHIRNAVEKLGSKEGGLMMVYGGFPGIPIENLNAVCDAFERYAVYYS